MTRKIGAKRRAALINDLINADFDLTELHAKYRLSPDHLSQWIMEEPNRQCLAGLCVLADLQTQLLLSRYRLVAAGRLIELATAAPEEGRAGLDNARRACVDLLKLDLKRADINAAGENLALEQAPDETASLRRLLYTSDEPDQQALIGDDRADQTQA
jgi:hypothetical protein